VIFEQSSQLPGLSKAFVKRKIFKKNAVPLQSLKESSQSDTARNAKSTFTPESRPIDGTR